MKALCVLFGVFVGIALGLALAPVIHSYTTVPEIKLRFEAPPAFDSVALCFGCSFEPWQRVIIAVNQKSKEHWTIRNINIIGNESGIGGEIYASCPEEK